jgi:enoyl-[acyl-carrier protein] reductase I
VTIGIQTERFRPALEKLVAGWPEPPRVVVCDLTKEEELAAAAAALRDACGIVTPLPPAAEGSAPALPSPAPAPRTPLAAVAHSVAWAPASAMRSPFLDIARDDFLASFNASVFSFVALARHTAPLLAASGGGSLLALS